MNFSINQMPFTMDQIVPKLFNSQFLSDVTFIIGNDKIFAHSLILMTRSSVLQTQLEPSLGEKQLIPINQYGYQEFYELIRFIYTDQHSCCSTKKLEFLKLAKSYNIVRLVNELLNSGEFSPTERLSFCVEEKHEIGVNQTTLGLTQVLSECLKSKELLSIQPDTMAVILKVDRIPKNVSEIDIINAVIRWMNHYSNQNQMQFLECRQKLEHLIYLLRFATLSNEVLFDVHEKNPNLLSQVAFANIAAQKLCGPDYKGGTFIDTPRKEFMSPFDSAVFLCSNRFETKFSVTSELIFTGFVFGAKFRNTKYYDITISCKQDNVKETEEIEIKRVPVTHIDTAVLCLGTSLHVRPNFTYTIAYGMVSALDVSHCKTRKSQTELIVKAPSNTVNIIAAHGTMLEMYFLEPLVVTSDKNV